jgi:hypothetical protein
MILFLGLSSERWQAVARVGDGLTTSRAKSNF